MAWVRFDDGFFRHPKVVTAGRDARDLFMASVFYANSNLTDGFVPEGAVPLIAPEAGLKSFAKAVRALLANGLWEPADGGYQIHDYLEYQASAEKVTALREQNAKRQEEYRSRKRNAVSNGQRNVVTNAPNNGPVTDPPINIPNPITSESSDSLSGERDSGPPSSSVQERFTRFWAAYPKKVGKGDAEKQFSRIRWSEIAFADLMAALESQKQSAQWHEENGRYIPNPSTWIYQKRWGDELPPAGSATPASSIAEPKGYSHDPDEAAEQMRCDLESLRQQAAPRSTGQVTPIRGRTA